MILCPYDWVMVQNDKPEEVSKGGIIIHTAIQDRHKPRRGVVIEVGKECKYVKAGDKVIYDQAKALYDGVRDGEGNTTEVVFLNEKDIPYVERGE